jgi:hypothetical protein
LFEDKIEEFCTAFYLGGRDTVLPTMTPIINTEIKEEVVWKGPG